MLILSISCSILSCLLDASIVVKKSLFHVQAQQLFAMFPQTSQDEIIQDLQRTNSVEATADNILEGLLSVSNFLLIVVVEIFFQISSFFKIYPLTAKKMTYSVT